nr:hypothetical protein [Tanacetum cinerariifolium]
METTIEQQVAMDEDLIPSAQRLRIGRRNFRLLSDIQSKESTLQLVYDVLRRCPFYKAFLVTADVPEIYMQEFWSIANVHQHSIRFKMDNKKHILDLESFRNILHICPRVQGQPFAELPFEEEILDFIRFLRHNATIRTLTDVNINKLYQPWRSFVAVINKCLSGKTTGYDIVHKNQKKSNEMYYPKFTKVIIHHFMSKDSSIPRRNKFGALLPIELTNEEIRNLKAHNEYYAIATGEAAHKPKASARRTRSCFDTSITPPTAIATPRPYAAATPRLTAAAKGKQTAKAPKAKSLSAPSEVAMTKAEQLKLVLKRSRQRMHISQPGGSDTDEGTGSKPGVPDVPTDESEEELSWNSTDDEGVDDEGKDDDADEDQEVAKHDDNDDTEESGDDDKEGESDEHESDEETREEESFDPIPQTPEDSEDEDDGEEDLDLNIGKEERHDEEEDEDELYRDQESSSVSSQFMTSMLNLTIDVGMESIFETTSRIDVQTPTSMAPFPMTIPTMTSSTIATTTTTSQALILSTLIPSEVLKNLPNFASVFRFDDRLRSLEQNFSEVMQTNQFADRLCEEAQKENDEFLKTVDENIKKIIKELVKEQVRAQVSKILPRIVQAMNEQLEAEVLTRSSHSSRTSYVVVVDLSEMVLKKILIEKIEGNKSIQRSHAQRNLYKALVDAYESDKIILDTYEETVTLTRRRDDDEDKDEEPFAGPDRGSKRRREGQQYPHNLLQPLPLIPDNRGRRVIPFAHFINNDLKYLRGGASSCKYTTSVTKTKAADCGHIKWIEDLVPKTIWIQEPIDYDKHALCGVSHWGRKRQQFYGFTVNQESARDVYSKRRIITVTELKIVEWHSYKHLDWITVRRDDDKLYKFKEGDFKRLRIQDIEDMLLVLVQGKLTNLIVEERVESYQKKLNLTKLDTYGSDLKRKEAYTAYSNPRGCIYHNKDKQNRLIRIDELHKFSDETLTDVRTALDDCLKGI